MSHSAFFNALHAAQVRMTEQAARDKAAASERCSSTYRGVRCVGWREHKGPHTAASLSGDDAYRWIDFA